MSDAVRSKLLAAVRRMIACSACGPVIVVEFDSSVPISRNRCAAAGADNDWGDGMGRATPEPVGAGRMEVCDHADAANRAVARNIAIDLLSSICFSLNSSQKNGRAKRYVG